MPTSIRLNLPSVLLIAGLGVFLVAFLVPVLRGQAPIRRTVLLDAPIPGTPEHEAIMVKVELMPGSTSGLHRHPGTEIGYVLAGGAVLEIQGRPEVALKAGDSFRIDTRLPHAVRAEGSNLEVLSVYLVEKGRPLVEALP